MPTNTYNYLPIHQNDHHHHIRHTHHKRTTSETSKNEQTQTYINTKTSKRSISGKTTAGNRYSLPPTPTTPPHPLRDPLKFPHQSCRRHTSTTTRPTYNCWSSRLPRQHGQILHPSVAERRKFVTRQIPILTNHQYLFYGKPRSKDCDSKPLGSRSATPQSSPCSSHTQSGNDNFHLTHFGHNPPSFGPVKFTLGECPPDHNKTEILPSP